MSGLNLAARLRRAASYPLFYPQLFASSGKKLWYTPKMPDGLNIGGACSRTRVTSPAAANCAA
jgi:hypothetical protein